MNGILLLFFILHKKNGRVIKHYIRMFRSKAKIPAMIKAIQTITNIKKCKNTKL